MFLPVIDPRNWKPSRKKVGFLLITFGALAVAYIFLATRLSVPIQSGVIYSDNTSTGQWVNLSSDIFRLYAYSAFYDDRPSLLSPPVVRIIAISDPIEEFERHKGKRLYCVLHHALKETVKMMKESPMAVGFGWPLNRRLAKEYIFTCPTVKGMIPIAIGITDSPRGYSSSCVPVLLPLKPNKQRDLGICMQVSYGNLDPYRIIEWLELQKLLGISMVGVYALSISNASFGVLTHYAKEGFVDLRKTEEIYAKDDRHYLLQGSPVINDCIYRHMYEFRRIVVIDFDEFIMPRKHHNLSDLMTYLDQLSIKKKSLDVNFAFRNNYFFLDLPPDETISPHSTILRYRKKVAVSPEGYSVKSIINPQACTHMHNHYCWGLTAEYSRYSNTGSVDPEIALNQHYKMCHFSKLECDAMMKNVTQDDTILPLKDDLTKRFCDKVKTIMEKNC